MHLLKEIFDLKNRKSSYFNTFIFSLILLSCLIFIVNTYSISDRMRGSLLFLDLIIVLVFSMEIVLRFIYAPKRKNFFKNAYNWIDLIAVIPYWFGVVDSQFLRIIRFFRFFRFSHKYLSMNDSYFNYRNFQKLLVIRVLVIIFIIIFISSSFIYLFENQANPNVDDFDDSLYFILVTIGTVGFGDIIPMTMEGRIITMATILAGIILIPWYVGNMVRYIVNLNDSNRKRETDELRTIRKILNFSNKKVRDVMKSKRDTFYLEDDVILDDEIINLIKKKKFSRIPIYNHRKDDMVGILFAKDLIGVEYGKPITEYMRKKVVHVRANERLNTTLNRFKKEKQHIFIVYNSQDVVLGIVTIEDILEEVHGEIEDEFDH